MLSYACLLRGRGLALIIISLLMLTSPAESLARQQGHGFPATELRVNGMAALRLSTDLLRQARIVAADGLTVILDNGQAFTLDTLTAKALGAPDADLTRFPDFMLNKVAAEDIAKPLERELPEMRKMILKSNAVTAQLPVRLESLSGTWLRGPEKSVIYLTDHQTRDLITLITTVNMPDEAIRKIILEGIH